MKHSIPLAMVLTLGMVLGLVIVGCTAQDTPTATVTAGAAAETSLESSHAIPASPTPAIRGITGRPARVTIATGGDPASLDCQQTDDVNMQTVTDNINESLLSREQNMELIPCLANSYQQLDPTTWEFKMRPGVKFTNGEDCDAGAAAFSINRIIDVGFNSEVRSIFETITKATVVDTSTVRIVTTHPDPILPARVSMLPIVPRQAVTNDPKGFANRPIGTGPYILVEWVRGSHMTLKVNPDYWGPKPQVTEVVVVPRQSPSARLAALKAGEVDLIRDLLPEQRNHVPKYATVQPGLQYSFVRINTANPALRDPRIRQAMNYAIDNSSIVNGLYSGMGGTCESQLMGPSHFGYNPHVKAFPYDLAKAKTLLRQAGYDGTELTLIGQNGRWMKDKELNEVVAQMLTKAGFNVRLVVEDWKSWLDSLFAKDNQPDLILVFTDNQMLDADRTYSNYCLSTSRGSTYHNDQVDKLLNDARHEVDNTKRLKMYQEVVQISGQDDPAFIYLVNLADTWGLSQRLDWKPRLDGRVLFATMRISRWS